MTIRDNRKQPMRIQPRTSSKAVTHQQQTNTARGITGNPTAAPAKRGDVQGYPNNVTALGIAPVDAGD